MFRRILVAVEDSQDLERIAGLVSHVTGDETQVKAFHVSLRQHWGGARFPLETADEAASVVEAAVFELRMAGLGARGEFRYAMVGKAAAAIADEAYRFGADLLVLGAPRRGELASRVLGSLSQRLLQLAPCPVLVALRGQGLAPADRDLSQPRVG